MKIRTMNLNFVDVGTMRTFFDNCFHLTNREDLHDNRYFLSTDIIHKQIKLITHWNDAELFVSCSYRWGIDDSYDVTKKLFLQMIEKIEQMEKVF